MVGRISADPSEWVPPVEPRSPSLVGPNPLPQPVDTLHSAESSLYARFEAASVEVARDHDNPNTNQREERGASQSLI
jgi:hypothetical protein